MAKSWIPISCACVAAISNGLQVQQVKEVVAPPRDEQVLEIHATHAGASLLGQVRSNFGAWLWLRTDLYLHNGVEMRPLTDQEVRAGMHGVGATDDGTDEDIHDDSKIVTLIPSSKSDFRGVFGDIDRATKSYKDMEHHQHNSPMAALPLFRLMTWIDPNFIEGWSTGAMVIGMPHTEDSIAKKEAFIEQGIEANPQSIVLWNELGVVRTRAMLNFTTGRIAFERAISIGRDHKVEEFSESEREGLLAAYRWLVLVYRDTGRIDEMFRMAKEGVGRFPNDPILERVANRPPLIYIDQTSTDPSKDTAPKVGDLPESHDEHEH